MAEADTPSPTVEPLLSLEEVTAVLRISERSLYRLLSRGEIGGLKVGGRTLIEPEELRRYIASRRRPRSNKETPNHD